MKKVLLGSLLAGGLLFAAKNNDVTTTRISGDEQISARLAITACPSGPYA